MGKIGDSNSNTCSVPECKSRSTNEITLFHYPKEEAQRKKWTDAIKIESKITQNMQVCSRHFVKSDYIISDNAGVKVKRLKRSAVPSQNLPWQFPNKRVSPTLAKARMERLKNRLQKVSVSPGSKPETSATKPETPAKKPESGKKSESNKIPESVSKSTEKTEDTEAIKNEVVSEEDDVSTGNTSVGPDVEKNESGKNNEETVEENGGEASEAKKDDNTPARGPTRLRQRLGTIKCEYCGRKCLTPQALQTHQQIAHKNARNNLINPKKDFPINNKTKSSPKPTIVPLISVKSPENLLAKPLVKAKPLNSREVEKVLQDDSDYIATESDSSELSVKEEIVEKQEQRKTEFECPKCKRRFAVYFMAYKHIQKHHSGTPNGSKTTNLLPKPTRIEICTICSTSVDSNSHICAGPLKLAMGLVCTGCELEYKTLTMFDMHKSSMHSDGVESMFFSTLEEFEHWKQKMENQTKAKYTILDQNDTKKIHRCTYRTRLGTGTYSQQRMCPSCVVVQEFTKGFQVHYYPNHYGHDCQKYSLSSAFQQYSISSLMNLTAKQLPDDEPLKTSDLDSPDLYLQFQKITETIVNEAARINVNGLKKLMRKALEMMEVINSYVEDDDDDGITSSNSILKLDLDKDNLQDDVKLALANFKRKSNAVHETPPKRSKSVFQSTENFKTPKNNRSSLSSNKETDVRKDTLKLNQSPTFIDTFQDFVGKTITKTDDRLVKKSVGRKTPPVKTKIGQFKPKTPPKKVSFSPTKISPSPKKSIKELEYEVKEQENDCNILILKI